MATNPQIREQYSPYPNNMVTPDKQNPDGIFILLKDPVFKDWVIEALELKIVDDPNHKDAVALSYGYTIAMVPKTVTNEDVERLRPQLQDFVGKVLFDILEVTAEHISTENKFINAEK